MNEKLYELLERAKKERDSDSEAALQEAIFSGMFQKTKAPVQEQIKGQESIETLEGGKYMPTPPAPNSDKQDDAQTEKPKKKGRPKLNRELKKGYCFTILPSIYEQSSEIASNEGKSLSQLISYFLAEYVKKNS